MTAKMYYDADADLRRSRGRPSRSSATAPRGTPMRRTCGTPASTVIVGLAEGSKSRVLAEAAGFEVKTVADAVQAADVIMIALPDTVQKTVYDAEIEPNLTPGELLMFAHGFNIRFGRILPPAGVDVGMVAPKGPGHLVRSVYEQGGGVPALFAVEQDAVRHGARARPRLCARATATPARASSRPPSRRRPRPTCSASRPSCAAASPR